MQDESVCKLSKACRPSGHPANSSSDAGTICNRRALTIISVIHAPGRMDRQGLNTQLLLPLWS